MWNNDKESCNGDQWTLYIEEMYLIWAVKTHRQIHFNRFEELHFRSTLKANLYYKFQRLYLNEWTACFLFGFIFAQQLWIWKQNCLNFFFKVRCFLNKYSTCRWTMKNSYVFKNQSNNYFMVYFKIMSQILNKKN